MSCDVYLGRRQWDGNVRAICLGDSADFLRQVKQQFPDMVAQPRDLSAALVFDHEFRHYVAQPNEKTTIQLGAAQVELLSKAFAGLFAEVKVVTSKEQAGPDTDLVIIPSVRALKVFHRDR